VPLHRSELQCSCRSGITIRHELLPPETGVNGSEICDWEFGGIDSRTSARDLGEGSKGGGTGSGAAMYETYLLSYPKSIVHELCTNWVQNQPKPAQRKSAYFVDCIGSCCLACIKKKSQIACSGRLALFSFFVASRRQSCRRTALPEASPYEQIETLGVTGRWRNRRAGLLA
jgi:hypothetical protein